nr:hypothetical protein [Nanoarchaeum sp.]
MGKKRRVNHNISKYKKKKRISLINHKLKQKNNTKKLLQKKKVKAPIFKFPKKSVTEKTNSTNNLAGSIEILKNKEQKIKVVLPKKEKAPKEKKIKEPRKKSVLGLKIFLLILFLLVGGVISYLFNNLYIHIVFGFLILFQLISILKTPRKKKEEIKKLVLPEQPKKIYLTEFDKFYNYINEKKKVSSKNISSHFRMPKKQ